MTESKKTLTDDAIEVEHEADTSRRSMLTTVGAVVGTGAAATVLEGCFRRRVIAGPVMPQQAVVQGYATGVTDSDGGPYADPAGNGRGGRRQACSGITDADGGPYADPGGCGRGRAGMQTGITDSDGGPYADPAGNGRGNVRQGYTGITDSDGGAYADPAGHGRGRWR